MLFECIDSSSMQNSLGSQDRVCLFGGEIDSDVYNILIYSLSSTGLIHYVFKSYGKGSSLCPTKVNLGSSSPTRLPKLHPFPLSPMGPYSR